MSKWVVRRATESDREWVVMQTAAFLDYTAIGIPVDVEQLNKLFDRYLSDPTHYLLIATNKGERQGVAAAQLVPHPLNTKVMVFSETMWWVPPEHRSKGAGLILLDALDRIGTAKAQLVVITTEHHSPLSGRTLTKRGYSPQETTHIKKVESCPQ